MTSQGLIWLIYLFRFILNIFFIHQRILSKPYFVCTKIIFERIKKTVIHGIYWLMIPVSQGSSLSWLSCDCFFYYYFIPQLLYPSQSVMSFSMMTGADIFILLQFNWIFFTIFLCGLNMTIWHLLLNLFPFNLILDQVPDKIIN